MRNGLLPTAFLLAIAVSPSLSSANAQQQSAKPVLSVSVRSPKTSYSIKESIILEIQLENVGTESLLVRRNWAWGVGRTDVRVLDSNGKDVFTTYLADELPQMPRANDFIELRPREFFGTRLSEEVTHFLNTPGTYDFFVEYTSSVSEEWVRKNVKLPPLPLWSRERGTIVSNKIRIEVTK
jgi:hypothetical protein